MHATMAREGDQIQVEQSDMLLDLKMAKIAKVVIWCATNREIAIPDQEISHQSQRSSEAGCLVSHI